jgi:hypothetical protein
LTSRQVDVVEPGVNVASVAPLAGRLPNVIAFSVQLVSATCLTLWTLFDPLVTNILSVAAVTLRPARELTSNFR